MEAKMVGLQNGAAEGYSIWNEDKSPCNNSNLMVSDDAESILEKKMPLTISLSLAGDIYKSISKNYADYINSSSKIARYQWKYNVNVPLFEMLARMAQIFSHQFSHMPEKNDGLYTVVLGNMGVGKSLLVGNLLNNPLVEKNFAYGTSGRTKKVLDYRFENSSCRPVIGHTITQTPGAPVYGNYIDTMALNPLNVEEKICSAAAINLAVRCYRPKKVIVLLSSYYLNTSYGSKFIELITTLSEMLDFSRKKNLWPHILFVFNDSSLKDKEELIVDIEMTLEHFKNIATTEQQKKLLKIFNQNKEWENVVSADFLTDRTREEILSWLQTAPNMDDPSKETGDPSENFNAFNSILEGKKIFITVLNAARTYFKHLEDQKRQCKRRVKLIRQLAENNSPPPLEDIKTKLKKLENRNKILRRKCSKLGDILEKDPDTVNLNERKLNKIKLNEDEAAFLKDLLTDFSNEEERNKLKRSAFKTYKELKSKLEFYESFNQLFKKIDLLRDQLF